MNKKILILILLIISNSNNYLSSDIATLQKQSIPKFHTIENWLKTLMLIVDPKAIKDINLLTNSNYTEYKKQYDLLITKIKNYKQNQTSENEEQMYQTARNLNNWASQEKNLIPTANSLLQRIESGLKSWAYKILAPEAIKKTFKDGIIIEAQWLYVSYVAPLEELVTFLNYIQVPQRTQGELKILITKFNLLLHNLRQIYQKA